MTNKKLKVGNVPNLRFPGFIEEWQTKKLGEIATFSKGKGISKSDIEENGITECIRYGELYTHYTEVINEIKSKTNVNTSTLVLSEENDVIIPASGETTIDIATASCVLKSGIALGGDLNIIKTANNGVFLSYYLNSKKKMEIANLAQGISVVHLYSSQLASLTLSLPKLNEQDRISSFLVLLDERIHTQNKIIEQLKTLIKGLSEKIFSQKIRFNEFNEEWEVQGLYDVLVKFDKTTTINNQYPILTSARTGIYFQKDYFDGNEVASKDNRGYNIVPRGYFTYRHMSDDVTFKFNINTICDKGIVSTLYPVFTTSGVNDYFLKTYLNEGQAFKNYALLQKQGGSRTYMYYNKLSKLKLLFPTLSEQNKISQFLSSIDAKIQAEKNILDKYQSQKKYLLQNLFI
ncbi:restriction endonuclease subunit S [Moheibacter sediminis]|uniref:Type I restriction enzyme, S subunit n=1 Tax=Moheibacter sediminis TaxID=1434700 RepID=A0A1W1YY40_9FLAO|nr:restriction endonuclease subunit S [Moheibacter sediminis]SMC40992.1 type I restriction enzyme, S subunit [Moheibacter sediminis]